MATRIVANPIAQAVEMAQIDMPKLYGRRKMSWWERTVALLKPGPKPRLSEVTYRGRTPPNLARFAKRAGEYRESPLDFTTMDLMRRYPIIKLGTVVRAAPSLTALREARVKCEDKRREAFIKTVVLDSGLLVRLAESSIMPSYIYGVAPHEKVWHTQDVKSVYNDPETGEEVVAWDGPALVYKKIKFVHPETLDRFLLQDETQDFAGFVQKGAVGEEDERIVEAWKAFVFINRFLYGGLWGESEYVDVYPYWYYAEFFRALQADFLQYKAVPPIIGWAPPGVRQNEDEEDVDNLAYAGEVLQSAYDNLVVILPFETDDRGNQKWGYRELNVSQGAADVYTKAVEELDIMMLRGLLVPERTVTQNAAAVGSYNQAEQHAERLLDMAKMEVDHMLDAVNQFLVPQLIEDHFGPGGPQVKVFGHSVSEGLKTKLYNLLITILQNDPAGFYQSQIHFKELLEIVNIPFTVAKNGLPVPQLPDEEDGQDDAKEKEEPN
jgi:hypothetical protein